MFEQSTVENVMNPEVQLYLDSQTEEETALLHYLRELILTAGDEFRETFRWSIPFYDSNGMCLYLQVRKGLVEIGFIKGHLLSDPAGLLRHESQKSIRHVRLRPADDVPRQIILNLIEEARILNRKG